MRAGPDTARVPSRAVTTPPNAQQRAAWAGDSGDHWATWAEVYEAGVAGYRDDLRAAAAVVPGERVLDVGCGFGTTTIDAATAAGPDGHALGVDLSGRMLDLARSRAAAAGAPASFALADAQVADLGEGDVDVVVSRNGVMFFDDPAAAFANLHRAVRPGGRIALQVWQPLVEQEWLRAVQAALGLPAPADGEPGPLALGDPDLATGLLTGAGFSGVELAGVRRPMWFGSDVEDAAAYHLSRVAGALAERSPARRDAAGTALRSVLADHLGPDGVVFGSAAWLVRAHRP